MNIHDLIKGSADEHKGAATPDHPAWRGNTEPSYSRPWYGPTNDAERVGMLWALHGALSSCKTIAAGLGTATDDYETSIQCLIERATAERRAILEGERG